MTSYMSSTPQMGNATRRGSGHFDIVVDGRITGIRLWTGIFVDAVEFQIDGTRWSPKMGGPGGSASALTLSRGEHIQSVEIQSGHIMDWIKFTTSSGRTLSGGGRGGGCVSTASFNGRIGRITGAADHCNGCYVLQNMAFHYTAGNHRTPHEERQEEERKEDRRRQEENVRRQELERRVAEAEQQRKEAEARAQKDAKAADGAKRSAIKSRIKQIDSHMGDVQREYAQVARAANQRRRELAEIQQAINSERAQLSDLSQERISDNTKVIVLLGMTGDGKSTLGNRLCGDVSEEGNDVNSPFRTSRRGDSETMEVQNSMSQIFGQKLCIVDTPGLDDSGGRDREHCNKLIHYLRGCGGVNQFFLVKNCANPRISGTFRSMLTRFEVMVGREFWRFVTIILTGVEGRHVRRMDEYRQDLVEAVSQAHGCPPVNVIGIGFDDGYQETIERLVTRVIPTKKFQCVALTSPVEELEAQAQVVAESVQQQRQKEDQITQRLRDLQRQKQECQQQLQRG